MEEPAMTDIVTQDILIHQEESIDTLKSGEEYWKGEYQELLEDVCGQLGVAIKKENVAKYLPKYVKAFETVEIFKDKYQREVTERKKDFEAHQEELNTIKQDNLLRLKEQFDTAVQQLTERFTDRFDRVEDKIDTAIEHAENKKTEVGITNIERLLRGIKKLNLF